MSNQIVITSGAKVRNLSGVLTATSGVVDSVGFGTANGVATLDSNGKVPLSQLPASVVTYLGTWNAATNTPTLANGTGDVGDLYICNVAGTVNFGAGPITFAVGDWVIYNGSQWQKSAGSSGTVTSVAMTVPTGLSVTGSPITTSGTLAVSLSSGYTIPTTSFLAGLVPYTGATTDVDLGAHVLNAQSLHVKGTAGAGHLGLKHQSAAATGTANESLIYANVDGDLAWQNDNLYLTTLSTHANTANRVYTFPNASGTIALTSDISYPVTSVFGRTGAVTAQSGDYTTTQVTEGTNLYFTDARARGAISLTTTGTSGAATYNSTTGVLNIPNYSETTFGTVTSVGLSSATSGVTIGSSPITTSGTITLAIATASGSQQGLLSSTDWTTFNGKQGAITLTTTGTSGAATLIGDTLNIPNYAPDLSNYVTLNTSQTISGAKTFSNNIRIDSGSGGLWLGFKQYSSASTGITGYTSIYAVNTDTFGISFGAANDIQFKTASPTFTRTYTFPDASGTVALTSDIPSLSGYVQGSGTTNYHAKFTGTSTIGNSMLTDDGTTLQSIGATRSNLYLKAASNSYYSQLAFTNGTNGSFGGLSYNNASQYMQFEVNSSEYMRLYGNGNLRLFTSSATDNGSKFQVEGAATFSSSVTANSGIIDTGGFNIKGTGGVAKPSMLRLSNASDAAYYWDIWRDNTTGYLNIGGATGGSVSTFLTIKDVSGNVGIGTSSPSQILDIVGTTPIINIQAGANTNGRGIQFNYNGSFLSGSLINYGATGETALSGGNTGTSGYFLTFKTDGSERMRITNTGNVGIGTSSPNYVTSGRTVVDINGTSTSLLALSVGGTPKSYFYFDGTDTQLYSSAVLAMYAGGSERMRITSGGYIVMGATSSDHRLRVIDTSAGNGVGIFSADNASYNSIKIYGASADGYNGAATVAIFGRNTSTNRSINAGGTINASGADYAEYMTKAIEDNIAKGDIVGIDDNGLLTNIFVDAKSFVIKSTNPSYVGGDTWGSVDDIGKLPEDATEQDKLDYKAKLEAARAKVDRIAFSGQVPCNVLGANVGDYIIPINDNGKITGQAVTNPTFEQYQISVGKVWKIMEDGRAWVAVKIG